MKHVGSIDISPESLSCSLNNMACGAVFMAGCGFVFKLTIDSVTPDMLPFLATTLLALYAFTGIALTSESKEKLKCDVHDVELER